MAYAEKALAELICVRAFVFNNKKTNKKHKIFSELMLKPNVDKCTVFLWKNTKKQRFCDETWKTEKLEWASMK